MEPKKSKIEESNKKRLESLKDKFNEFRNKKKLIRSSLNDLDLDDKKPKKILFSDSDSEKKKEIYEETNSIIFQKTNPTGNKKLKLIDSESDSDSDFLDKKNDAQKKEVIKMFESKINMEEKKANKLVYLKSKFSNNDSRFKIDDRFVEDENEVDLLEKQNCEKISKKQLKKENLNSLKILEEITGKQIIKPKSLQEKENDIRISKLNKLAKVNGIIQNKMIRYDPTKSDHKVYEVENSESDSSSDSSEEEQIDDEKNESGNEDLVEEPEIKGDVKTFFQVEPNLKELFSSNDVFKFKFTDEIEENEENDEKEKENDNSDKKQINKNQFLRDIGLDKFNKSNYSSSETESEDEENKFVNREKNVSKIIEKKNENHSFLPNFNQDEQLINALSFFCRPDDFDLENVRKEWLIKRDTLIKESKKKHKKMVRIKRTKENNNMFPWIKKSNNDKNHHKKRKT